MPGNLAVQRRKGEMRVSRAPIPLASPRISWQVVAFIKGTRTQPQCGFSHKMLTILNTLKAEYEVVNVLDEVRAPPLLPLTRHSQL
jgi:hypothetical protein